MRKKIVAGNWKMNLLYAEAMSLVDSVIDALDDSGSCEIIFAPPSIYIQEILSRIQKSPQIALASQNCSEHTKGAFTGELSAAMLASVGAEYVLIGHSERRALFHETDAQLALKVTRAIENSLIPVFCCGETRDERNKGLHQSTIRNQLEKGLFHLTAEVIRDCVIAYEPVWAIGTGVNASSAQAQEMHAFIRQLIREKYSEETAEQVSLLYGGSVTSKNAVELFSCKDVDGGLVGGASLKSEEFTKIIAAMNTILNKS
ncbi:MAG TPA: triose-phosphate isomerase [Bacteroidia bacterium]|nr:triose-phosphate isomerase [Bacteroidia bacterium]